MSLFKEVDMSELSKKEARKGLTSSERKALKRFDVGGPDGIVSAVYAGLMIAIAVAMIIVTVFVFV